MHLNRADNSPLDGPTANLSNTFHKTTTYTYTYLSFVVFICIELAGFTRIQLTKKYVQYDSIKTSTPLFKINKLIIFKLDDAF